MQLALRSKNIEQLSGLDHLARRKNFKKSIENYFCNIVSKKTVP